MSDEKNPIDFERALAELNDLVEKMEKGSLTLQDSLHNFEKGISLIRQCQQELQDAEQKVKILTAQQKLESYREDENS